MSNETDSVVVDNVVDVLGYPEMLSLLVLLVGLLALAGFFVLKKRLERLQSSQDRLEDEMSETGRAGSQKEIDQALEVSRSAVELLDQLREEIVALQFVRGANTAVIDRLDHALERLHEVQPDANASRATADALIGIVREVKEMRLAYAATSRKLEQFSTQMAAAPEPAEATAKATTEPAAETATVPEYDNITLAARQAVATFGQDRGDPI